MQFDYYQYVTKLLQKLLGSFCSVILDFSRPGRPTDNPFIESFNGSFRDECLNTNWFLSLPDARAKIESFRRDYNSYRPHSSLQGMTPEEA
jgi:putative transposase